MNPKTFTALFDDVTARRPDHVAVDDGEWRLTYRELNAHGTSFARRLIEEGVAARDRVVVLSERGIPGLVAILGALKAGAVYVPLDPQNPPARLAYILEDVRPAMVIGAERQLEPARIIGARCVALDELRAGLSAGGVRPDRLPSLPRVDERDVAYCMYTSGSTGEPRGVEIEHRSVVAFIRAFNAYMRLDDDSRYLNTSPYYFDVSISDVLMPLALGATVYMVRNLLPPGRVLERIEQGRVTHFCPPAPLLTLLCGPGSTFEKRSLTSLECIMTGAEVIGRHVVEKWLGAVPGLRILNAYGPTEATCACLAHEITSANLADHAELPIGRPFDGIDAVLLDPDTGQPSEVLTGELAVAGAQVMRGYWNRPAETAVRTVVRNGRAYYRTGDICEIDGEGRYYFRGRKDNEVKVRGYRVNLDEISQALLRDDRVSQALAGMLKLPTGDTALGVALVLKQPESVAGIDDIVGALGRRLPAYMLPQHGLICDGFPKLPSGKTDARRTIELLSDGVNRYGSRWLRLAGSVVAPVA